MFTFFSHLIVFHAARYWLRGVTVGFSTTRLTPFIRSQQMKLRIFGGSKKAVVFADND